MNKCCAANIQIKHPPEPGIGYACTECGLGFNEYPIKQPMKERVEKFIDELNDLFREHKFTIECHAEFVSVLEDTSSGNNVQVCCLYGDCEPDYDEIESGEK